MNYILTIAKKEFAGYFKSLSAYMVLIGFLVISGWFFANPLFLSNQSDLRGFFGIAPMIFLIFIPATTMGLVSKENNTGTIELLTTMPVKSYQIVLGKYISAIGLIAIGMLFTMIYPITILHVGTKVDIGAMALGYLGLFLLAGVFTAIGTFTSCLTKNQIVAFIVSFFICFFFYIIDAVLFFIPSGLGVIFQYMSVNYHLSTISKGVVDSRNIIYFASMIFLFLKLSSTALEMKKR